MKKSHAFTLIEMLVVIAIIGIVAAMVVSGAAHAKIKQREAQVNGNKRSIMTMIENYKSKLNFYPPDNGKLATVSDYDGFAATNPLVYELVGAANNFPPNGTIHINHPFNSATNIAPSDYSLFYRQGVNNGNSDEPHDFYIPPPKSAEYAVYATTTSGPLVGLTVPVDGPAGLNVPNFWHYDSSTTRRHNPNGYDLWAEYTAGSKGGSNIIITNGNW